MTDLAQASDADLLASIPVGVRQNNPLNIKNADGSFASYPTPDAGMAAADQNLQAYGSKHGIDTIAGVVNRWAPASDGNDPQAYAQYVGQRSGIDPAAQIDLSDPATRAKVLAPMREYEIGDRAPTSMAGVSDADLLASIGSAPPATASAAVPAAQPDPMTGFQGNQMVFKDTMQPIPDAQVATIKGLAQRGMLDANAAPGSSTRPIVQRVATDAFAPGSYYIDTTGKLTQAPAQPSAVGDMAQSAASGAADSVAGLGDQILKTVLPGVDPISRGLQVAQALAGAITGSRPQLPQLPSAQAAIQPDLHAPQTTAGRYAQAVGEMAPAALAPGSAIERMANVVAPGLASEGASQLAQSMGASPMVQQAARVAGGLFGAGGASLRANPAAAAKAMTLDQVGAAKNAAYAKVDASGFTFPQPVVQNLADDIASTVASKGGPSGARLYPAATAMSERISALADQPNGVPLSQLDSLRSDIYGALVKPADREAPLGVMMRQKIDGLINSSDAPDIQDARDLNTRYSKMQSITDKLDSAGLRSASTYSGGNYPNAVRQSLRPLVDPTSAQQIGNLTPEEDAALRQAVTGTAGQNLTRYASKFLTNKFVQVPASLMTHGVATPVMEAAGAVLNKVGEGQTASAVQKVLDTIARGRAVAAARAAPLAITNNPYAGMAPILGMAPAFSAFPALSQPRQTPQ